MGELTKRRAERMKRATADKYKYDEKRIKQVHKTLRIDIEDSENEYMQVSYGVYTRTRK